MKALFLAVASCLVAGAAAAQPTVTNRDHQSYHLGMDCDDIEFSQEIGPGNTVTLDSYHVGQNCQLGVYPADNPWGKDGNLDPRKRLGSAKLKKDSECVIAKGRVTCE
jgi:hypothetical protein